MSGTRLDAIDRKLLLALSKDGRRAGSDLARQLGLSRQAVAERIRDLERRGLVRGYSALVDPASLGLSVRAHIRLALDAKAGSKGQKEIVKRLAANPMVRSVHRVSGEDCFVVQLVCRRIEDVNGVLADLQKTRAVHSSRTAFVLETLVEKGAFGPIEEALLPEEAK
jgi:Lrp/AsnC family leucine-responsive transcriptional regulator